MTTHFSHGLKEREKMMTLGFFFAFLIIVFQLSWCVKNTMGFYYCGYCCLCLSGYIFLMA